VFRLQVFERDAWICQLCRGTVDRTLIYPHPLSASLDHAVALARGGSHTYGNTQLAHLRCNSVKRAA
jgi:5-methylcytosine-specific restriction endonuclease McrA